MIVLTLTACRCRDRRKRDWRTHFTTGAQHTTEATVAGRKKTWQKPVMPKTAVAHRRPLSVIYVRVFPKRDNCYTIKRDY